MLWKLAFRMFWCFFFNKQNGKKELLFGSQLSEICVFLKITKEETVSEQFLRKRRVQKRKWLNLHSGPIFSICMRIFFNSVITGKYTTLATLKMWNQWQRARESPETGNQSGARAPLHREPTHSRSDEISLQSPLFWCYKHNKNDILKDESSRVAAIFRLKRWISDKGRH